MTMQDRFKFRVWADTVSEYLNPKDWVMGLDGEFYFINKDQNALEFCDDEFITKEQCTGLKDKNGKLIYEGDIVRQISKREPEYEEYITVVEWCGFGYPLYDKEEFDYVIIGNIHENPDLLENKDE